MSVILYEMEYSPFCIPIARALDACGVPFERKEVPNWDRSEILELTKGAYYAVPVLVHDDVPIFESGPATQDVARHVDRTWAGGALFPPAIEGPHCCTLDFLENDVEGRTFKLRDIHGIPAIGDVAQRGMVIRHKERKFGRGCIDEWRRHAAQIREEADALLARFETTLVHQPFLFGNKPVYADFLLYGILKNLIWNGWNRLNPHQHYLAEWMGEMDKVQL